MKKYSIADLKPDMVVGQPIYSPRGQLILEEGTVLTEGLISRLGFYGVYDAMIQDIPEDITEDLELVWETEPPAPENTVAKAFDTATKERSESHSYSQRVKALPEFQAFQSGYAKELSSLQNSFSFLQRQPGHPVNTDQLMKETLTLLHSAKSTGNLFDMLHNMRKVDDSIYAHCLNVALIARTMGRWMNYPDDEIEVLTLCGLFHDIGKTALSKELLNKPGRYSPSEFNIIKQHPVLGYNMIKDLPLDPRIKTAVLTHHERCDGSGYPKGLHQNELEPFAMIIAIADVYDAMTAARSYRDPLCPFQVIAAFEREGLQKYHPKFILTFLEHIADTYQHNLIMLNTGQTATIVMINKQHLTQPFVQLSDNTIVDMTTKKDWEIISIL